MKKPQQDEVDHWLKVAREGIARKRELMAEGFYQKENLPIQGAYTTLALKHASLARAKFLNGDVLPSVRQEFATAAKYIIKSFTMAYDENDPDYVGDQWPPKNPHYTGRKDSLVDAKWLDPGYGQVSWSDVSETDAIDGFYYALMAADFDTAKELARLYQDRKDGHKMDVEVNRYAHALKYALLDEKEKGAALLKLTIDALAAKPPKQIGKINYFVLSLILHAILENDEKEFNRSLALYLEFYAKSIIRAEDYFDTDEEFICDDAVALANLALNDGLKVTVEHDLLPKGLLIEPVNG